MRDVVKARIAQNTGFFHRLIRANDLGPKQRWCICEYRTSIALGYMLALDE